MWIRWLKFNAVGAAGVIVQIGTLWMLVERGKIPYLSATLIATEMAVLHNFFWHLRWTWADRPASVAESFARLVWFNLTNGAVSLVGNLLMMTLLTGWLKVPYVTANLASIGACCLVNFVLSEGFVFRARVARATPLVSPDTVF